MGRKTEDIFNNFMSSPGKTYDGVHSRFYFNNGDVSRHDFPLPQCLEDAIRSKLDSRKYGYSRSQGNAGICKKVSNFESSISGNDISKSNVCLTTGVTNGLDLVFDYLGKGEIIIPTPSYPIGGALASRHGLDMVDLKTQRENNFLPTPEEIGDLITDKTKAVLITSPNNPTGAEFSFESMREIYSICEQNDVHLVVDEIFSGLMLNGGIHPRPNYDIDKSKVIRVNGWSKDRGVAGFRIGYVVASPEIIDFLSDTICTQYGNAPTLFNNFISKDMIMRKFMVNPDSVLPQFIDEFNDYSQVIIRNLKKYEDNHEIINQIMGSISQIRDMTKTEGGFSKYIRFDKVEDDVEFAKDLFYNTGVLLVPGIGFNSNEKGWMRLTFSTHPERLELGLNAIKKHFANK